MVLRERTSAAAWSLSRGRALAGCMQVQGASRARARAPPGSDVHAGALAQLPQAVLVGLLAALGALGAFGGPFGSVSRLSCCFSRRFLSRPAFSFSDSAITQPPMGNDVPRPYAQ